MEIDEFIKNKSNEDKEVYVPEVKDWKRFVVTPDSSFFPIFQRAIKDVKPGTETITISIINKIRSESLKQTIKDTFKFEFSWQDEEVCGIEVFKKVKEEDGKPTR